MFKKVIGCVLFKREILEKLRKYTDVFLKIILQNCKVNFNQIFQKTFLAKEDFFK